MEDSIQRVKYYEALMDEIRNMIGSDAYSAVQLQKIRLKYEELRKYYSSLDWMNDFEADEAGKFPDDLKRGVLSEDGIDHLFDEMRDWSSKIIERMMEKPGWVIDILPWQIPPEGKEHYLEIERFFLDEPGIYEIRRKFAEIILKLNCYYPMLANHSDISLWHYNPEPADIAGWIIDNISENGVLVVIPEEETLFVIRRDDTYMTVYNPPGRLLEILKKLSQAEGLFVWNK